MAKFYIVSEEKDGLKVIDQTADNLLRAEKIAEQYTKENNRPTVVLSGISRFHAIVELKKTIMQ